MRFRLKRTIIYLSLFTVGIMLRLMHTRKMNFSPDALQSPLANILKGSKMEVLLDENKPLKILTWSTLPPLVWHPAPIEDDDKHLNYEDHLDDTGLTGEEKIILRKLGAPLPLDENKTWELLQSAKQVARMKKTQRMQLENIRNPALLADRHITITKKYKNSSSEDIVPAPATTWDNTISTDPYKVPGYAYHYDANRLWPTPGTHGQTRIMDQLYYIPKSYQNNKSPKLKTIIMPTDFTDPTGTQYFVDNKCSVDRCILKKGRWSVKADAVVFAHGQPLPQYRRPGQIWIVFDLESPLVQQLDYPKNLVNWTATYRTDSTLVTPYEHFVYTEGLPQRENISNYAQGKTKLVAWFVSNCRSSQRMKYARSLQEYLTVDIYGKCGEHECSTEHRQSCFHELKKHYKFYLAFENTNCVDYITEKLYQNSFWNDVVPVVMGGRKQDYLAAAPPNSFIHVDDFKSPKALAEYLLLLDSNDHLYNQYFLWKSKGTFINTKFWCRVCALLHDDSGHKSWYEDVGTWWKNNDTCVSGSWNDQHR